MRPGPARPLRTSLRALAATALVATLAACGTSTSGDGGDGGSPDGKVDRDRVDSDRMLEVADDEDATAAEVVEAGRAVDADRAGDGSLLVTYTVHNDDDEGRSAAAWRLYDAAGVPVSEGDAGVVFEGHAYAQVWGLEEGFLVQDADYPEQFHVVATDGTVTDVRTTREPMVARPGDVPVSQSDFKARLFRPETATVFRALPDAGRDAQGWALADDGTLWSHDWSSAGEVPVRRSAGRAWESVPPVQLDGEGGFTSSFGLAVAGDWVAVALLGSPDNEGYSMVTGVAVRPAGGPADAPWTTVGPGPLAGRRWYDVPLRAVDDHTVMVDDSDQPRFLLDLETQQWVGRLELPDPDEYSNLEVGRDGVYAFTGDTANGYFTDDLGKTWELLPH